MRTVNIHEAKTKLVGRAFWPAFDYEGTPAKPVPRH
jgi:hypothetical protein